MLSPLPLSAKPRTARCKRTSPNKPKNSDDDGNSCRRALEALPSRLASGGWSSPLSRSLSPVSSFRVPKTEQRNLLGAEGCVIGSEGRRSPRPHRPQRRRQNHSSQNPLPHHPPHLRLGRNPRPRRL